MSQIDLNLNNMPAPQPSPPALLTVDRPTLEKSLAVLTSTLSAVAMLTNNEFLKRLSAAADQLTKKPYFVDLLMDLLVLVNRNATEAEYRLTFNKYGMTLPVHV